MDKDGHILPIDEIKDDRKNVPENVSENVPENVPEISTAEKRRLDLLRLMKQSPKITTDCLANILHVSRKTVSRDINYLKSHNLLSRDGDDKGGRWIVKE